MLNRLPVLNENKSDICSKLIAETSDKVKAQMLKICQEYTTTKNTLTLLLCNVKI